MPRIDSYSPGTPSWVDLASPDVEASVAFYGGLFGWEAPELAPEAGGYRTFELGGVAVAGCGPIMMEGQPPAWLTYVSVDDADGAVARITEAGGTVYVQPMDVLDVGRMAVFADPTGGACAVWQAKAHIGAGLVNEPGALVWNELATRDTESCHRLLLPGVRLGGQLDRHGWHRLHRVEARRRTHRRDDGDAVRDSRRSTVQLARLLRYATTVTPPSNRRWPVGRRSRCRRPTSPRGGSPSWSTRPVRRSP